LLVFSVKVFTPRSSVFIHRPSVTLRCILHSSFLSLQPSLFSLQWWSEEPRPLQNL